MQFADFLSPYKPAMAILDTRYSTPGFGGFAANLFATEKRPSTTLGIKTLRVAEERASVAKYLRI